MFAWIAMSVMAAAALGIVMYKKSKSDKGAPDVDDPDNNGDSPDTVSKTIGKKVFTKFNDTAVRTSAVVDNGTLGMGTNLIARLVPNIAIGSIITEVTGEDGYIWYKVKLLALPAFNQKAVGYIRSDVAKF